MAEERGHRLHPEDLAGVLKARPEVLVIGTGYSGVMKVSRETMSLLVSLGIEVKIERTGKAVKMFNALQAGHKQVIAALHLTC